jgi:hypothetical protein
VPGPPTTDAIVQVTRFAGPLSYSFPPKRSRLRLTTGRGRCDDVRGGDLQSARGLLTASSTRALFQQQLAGGVDVLDTLVESPLKDGLAQEIRVAVEQRLEQDLQMPAFWSQLGVDYTNAREDVRGEADRYAFTDAMVLGYALRWVASDRADGRSVPDDIALQLEDLGQDHQGRALEIVVDVAGSRLSEIRALTGEAWDEFDYWAWQFVATRSRTRRGSPDS